MHIFFCITKDKRVTFYDHTKGGVDLVDLGSTNNTTKMRNQR